MYNYKTFCSLGNRLTRWPGQQFVLHVTFAVPPEILLEVWWWSEVLNNIYSTRNVPFSREWHTQHTLSLNAKNVDTHTLIHCVTYIHILFTDLFSYPLTAVTETTFYIHKMSSLKEETKRRGRTWKYFPHRKEIYNFPFRW
jgi:hypothetical protein